jgi:hypothetical protein
MKYKGKRRIHGTYLYLGLISKKLTMTKAEVKRLSAMKRLLAKA